MFEFEAPHMAEIAPDVFRFSQFAPALNLQFNYFLVRDDEPLLFTTGFKSSFPDLLEAVSGVIDPAKLRWVGFSHFESDECGALNRWLEVAPQAAPVCSMISAMVNLNDFADRQPRGMQDGETLETGKYRFRFCSTAQFPHGWDAGLLFEETQRTLFCSDLMSHNGNVAPLVELDISTEVRDAMAQMQASPLAGYMPYTPQTQSIVSRLADLQPRTLAIMHGSSYLGDGAAALHSLGGIMRELLSGPTE